MAEGHKKDDISNDLNDRERSILHHVVDQYIRTAVPIGSRVISKTFESHLSPATIRNVMADLEELGYLSHPHTSAGRVPTDLGYRYYVDYLMEVERLREIELREIHEQLDRVSDQAELLRVTSKLLSRISRQLSIVSSPHISSGILEKLELIPLSSSKLLVVLSIRSGIVKTIMLEIGGEIDRRDTERISALLNQRLCGLSLQQIRESFVDRMKEVHDDKSGLIRLFIESVDQLYAEEKNEKLHISGTQNIIEQPEFIDPKNFRSVIEMIENEDIIVHLLEKRESMGPNPSITIGSENTETAARRSPESSADRAGTVLTKNMNKTEHPNEDRSERPRKADGKNDPTPPEDQKADVTPQEALGGVPEASEQEAIDRDKRLEELQQQVAQYKDHLLRKAADFENFKKRTESEISLLARFANEDLVLAFLPVVDDIERALKSAKGDDDEATLRKGIELILQKIMKVLESNGVKPMQTVGKTFDVNYHDVLLQIQSPGVLPNTIVEEVERGYLMHDKVIRHAKVIVAAGPEESGADIPDKQSADQGLTSSSGASKTP